MPTPEERACLEWALRAWVGKKGELYVTRDAKSYLMIGSTGPLIVVLNPSSSSDDALSLFLAQAMKLKLAGRSLGDVREELLAGGFGKQAANSVHEHLADISDCELSWLRGRIRWYRDDNGTPVAVETADSGES